MFSNIVLEVSVLDSPDLVSGSRYLRIHKSNVGFQDYREILVDGDYVEEQKFENKKFGWEDALSRFMKKLA